MSDMRRWIDAANAWRAAERRALHAEYADLAARAELDAARDRLVDFQSRMRAAMLGMVASIVLVAMTLMLGLTGCSAPSHQPTRAIWTMAYECPDPDDEAVYVPDGSAAGHHWTCWRRTAPSAWWLP